MGSKVVARNLWRLQLLKMKIGFQPMKPSFPVFVVRPAAMPQR
jgi:hypothetical protein